MTSCPVFTREVISKTIIRGHNTIMSCVIGIYTRTNIIVQVKNYQLKIDEMRIINVAIKRTFIF